MIIRIFLVSAVIVLAYSTAVDHYFVDTVHIQIPNAKLNCKNTNLTIDGKLYESTCHSDGETLLLTGPSFPAIVKKNVSVDLITSYTSKNTSLGKTLFYSYSLNGPLSFDQTFASNTPQSSVTNLTGSVDITATPFPTTKVDPSSTSTTPAKPPTVETAKTENSTAVLTLTWIHIKIDDTKTTVKKNGGAVAVAIIEGIALICILAFFGYRVMVARSVKNHSSNVDYSFDHNSGNIMRMNDIPPPREPRPPVSTTSMGYPTNNPTNSTIARAPVTTPDLVVPTSNSNTNSTFNTVPNTNDPFATLDSW